MNSTLRSIVLARPSLSIGGVFDEVEKGFAERIEKEFTSKKDFLYRHVYLQSTETKQREDVRKLEALKKKKVDIIFTGGVISATPTWKVFKDTTIPIVAWGYGIADNLKIKKKVGEPTGIHLAIIEYMVEASELYKFTKEILPSIKNIGIIMNEDMVVDKLFVKNLLRMQGKGGFCIEPVRATPSISKDDVKKYDLLYGITGAEEYLPRLIEWKKKILMSISTKFDDQIFAFYAPNTEIIGQQGGEVISKILNGEDIARIPIQGPKVYKKFVNIDIARKLGVNITPNMFKYRR